MSLCQNGWEICVEVECAVHFLSIGMRIAKDISTASVKKLVRPFTYRCTCRAAKYYDLKAMTHHLCIVMDRCEAAREHEKRA